MSNTENTHFFCTDSRVDEYPFKRDFYDDVETALKSTVPVTFLLGPRKCGKTVCLHQIEHKHSTASYWDVKGLTDDERVQLMYRIQKSILANEEIVYLIDEVTYWQYPDNTIELFASAYSSTRNTRTKVVLAGSQSRALEAWGHKAFAGSANFIRMSFMDYSEWLRYSSCEPSVESYNQFLFHIDKFYNMSSLADYLQGCLDETVVSNTKTSNLILNNECDLLEVSLLLDVLYAVLISRHIRSNPQTFSSEGVLAADMRRYFGDSFSDTVKSSVQQFLVTRYASLSRQSLSALRQAMCFLYNCGLISITHTITSANQEVGIKRLLFNDSMFEQQVRTKQDFFRIFNFSIKHPMFYLAVLKLVLREHMPRELPPELLGSLVECHVRGLLPEAYGFEYHDDLDRELDYLNVSYGMAVEITITDKKLSRTHFECAPNCPLKILTTKTRLDAKDDIYRIPYFLFIEFLSRRFQYAVPDLWALLEELQLG